MFGIMPTRTFEAGIGERKRLAVERDSGDGNTEAPMIAASAHMGRNRTARNEAGLAHFAGSQIKVVGPLQLLGLQQPIARDQLQRRVSGARMAQLQSALEQPA